MGAEGPPNANQEQPDADDDLRAVDVSTAEDDFAK
jgi:hypothetical protein